MILKGIGVSEGYGFGTVKRLKAVSPDTSSRAFTDAKTETKRFQNAVDELTADLGRTVKQLTEEEAEILKGHLAILSDPLLSEQIRSLIESGMTAEASAEKAFQTFSAFFLSAEKAAVRQKETDINDVRKRLLCLLLGEAE